MSVRLDWLERGLYEALRDCADVVAWSHGEQPRGGGSLLSLHLDGGPSKGLRGGSRHGGEKRPRATSALVTIDSVTEGQRLELRLDDFRYRHDVAEDEDVDVVRDQLMEQIAEVDPSGFDIEPSGTGGMLLTPTSIASLYDINATGDVSVEIEHDGYVRVARYAEIATLHLEAFTRDRSLGANAHAILTTAFDQFRNHDVLCELQRWGAGVEDIGDSVDQSAVVGGGWESQAMADIRLKCRSIRVEPVSLAYDITVEANLQEYP